MSRVKMFVGKLLKATLSLLHHHYCVYQILEYKAGLRYGDCEVNSIRFKLILFILHQTTGDRKTVLYCNIKTLQ